MGGFLSCLCCCGAPDDDHDEQHMQSLNSAHQGGCQCLDCLNKPKKDRHQHNTQETLPNAGNFSSNGGERTADRSASLEEGRSGTSDNSQVTQEPILPPVVQLISEIERKDKTVNSNSDTRCPGQSSKSGVKKEPEAVKSYYSLPLIEIDDCPICLDEYDEDNPKIIVQCSHHFHLSCIYEWLERSESCPTCRELLLFVESN